MVHVCPHVLRIGSGTLPQLQPVHFPAERSAPPAMWCPVLPCPYCILGVDHDCDFDHVIEAWDVIHDDYQTNGGCEFGFAIKRIAYLWLSRAQELEMTAERLHAVSQDPLRPTRWDPTPIGTFSAFPVNKRPRTSIFTPSHESAAHSGSSSAASSSSQQIPPIPPPPIPPPPPDKLALVPVQEEAVEWPQFDYHREKKSGRKWVTFREEDQALLRAAWLAGQTTLMLNVDGYEYDIDLTPHQESQVARHTGFRRRIRVRHETD